jgi:hypothetical protein
MPSNRPELPIAHIHAPRYPHEAIEIIGNRPGVERLINILIDSLNGKPAKGPVFTSDGFDCEVRAVCLQGQRRAEEWKRGGSPHWDVEDPLVARILDLTEENGRLLKAISGLRRVCKSITQVDHFGGIEATDGGKPAQG